MAKEQHDNIYQHDIVHKVTMHKVVEPGAWNTQHADNFSNRELAVLLGTLSCKITQQTLDKHTVC